MLSGDYINVGELAAVLGLPRAWLEREAEAGRVPCLMVGQRRMFDLSAVRQSLASLTVPIMAVPRVSTEPPIRT